MTSPTRVILDPKREAEIVTLPFDFASKMQLPFNDVLSAPTTTVVVWSGVDPNPSAMLVSTTASGSQVLPKVQGGIAGVIYLLKVVVQASLSGTLELDGLLAVLPAGM